MCTVGWFTLGSTSIFSQGMNADLTGSVFDPSIVIWLQHHNIKKKKNISKYFSSQLVNFSICRIYLQNVDTFFTIFQNGKPFIRYKKMGNLFLPQKQRTLLWPYLILYFLTLRWVYIWVSWKLLGSPVDATAKVLVHFAVALRPFLLYPFVCSLANLK